MGEAVYIWSEVYADDGLLASFSGSLYKDTQVKSFVRVSYQYQLEGH